MTLSRCIHGDFYANFFMALFDRLQMTTEVRDFLEETYGFSSLSVY